MKKISLLLTLMLVALTINAQSFKGNFHSIKASSMFQITLVKATSCSVNIECSPELEQYLNVRIEDGVLKLLINKTNPFTTPQGTIKAYVKMPELRNLELSGASKLTSKDEFTTTTFNCELSGAANIESLAIKASSDISLETSGASKSKMTLTAKNFSSEFSGASASNLVVTADAAQFDISGASNITGKMNIKNKSSIELSGAAKATLTGSTSKIWVDASGASSLDASELVTITGEIELSSAANVMANISGEAKVSKSGASRFDSKGKGRVIVED